MSPERVAMRLAESAEDIAAAKELFQEYAASLGFPLCFQGFDSELATLPGKYASPSGRLFLLWCEGAMAGCGALRPLEVAETQAETCGLQCASAAVASGKLLFCEMKRLYVRPRFRGLGLGRTLAQHLISEAKAIGYARLRLDTVPKLMTDAQILYQALGFYEIPAYYHNPLPDVSYLELRLK